MLRLNRSFPLLLLLLTISYATCSAQVQDTINGDKNPASGFAWTVGSDVGWFYTPGSSYTLGGVDTKFGSGDMRTVTVEVYSAANNTIGSLLRSGTFTPVADTFTGGNFSGLDLTAGTQYFIGFRNVLDLGVNITNDAGATNLGVLRYSSDGSYSNSFDGSNNFNGQPILRFRGTVVPAPTSLLTALMGALPGTTLLLRRRRRR